MQSDSQAVYPLPMPLQLKIRLFLLSFRWASLFFALILLLMQENISWWIILAALAYNVVVTVYLKTSAKGYDEDTPLLLLDLVASIFLIVAAGYTITDPALNPFFLHSFTPLLAIGFTHATRDALMTALLLSLSYFFAPVNSSGEPLAPTEFLATHIANSLSFFFVAIIISQVASALKHFDGKPQTLDSQTWGDVDGSQSYLDLLSSREREIFLLLCEGRSSNEIAEKLFVSENTAKNHISGIYKKLGVRNRAELICTRSED